MSSKRAIILQKFSAPNTSSINARTRCTFSSLICTKMLPLSVSISRISSSRSRRYVRYEWMPSSHVSRKARICSGSRVRLFVVAVPHVALVGERLEVRAVFDAVGRVEVDALHLARHAVRAPAGCSSPAANRPAPCGWPTAARAGKTRPPGSNRTPGRRTYRAAPARCAAHPPCPRWRDALVDMQRHRLDIERHVLGLAGPHQLRVEPWVVASSACVQSAPGSYRRSRPVGYSIGSHRGGNQWQETAVFLRGGINDLRDNRAAWNPLTVARKGTAMGAQRKTMCKAYLCCVSTSPPALA